MSVKSGGGAKIAADINKLLVERGGEEIAGLENLAPAELKALKDGLSKFDEFAKQVQKNPVLANFANNEAQKFVRDLAKSCSCSPDAKPAAPLGQPATPAATTPAPAATTPAAPTRIFTGMCGGGGHAPPPPAQTPPPPPPPQAPPPPVAPPVAQTPPTPPPPVAPPVAQTTTPPVNVAPPSGNKPEPVTTPPGNVQPLGNGNPVALGLIANAQKLKNAGLINDSEFAELTNANVGPQDVGIGLRALSRITADTPNAAALARAVPEMNGQILELQNQRNATARAQALGNTNGTGNVAAPTGNASPLNQMFQALGNGGAPLAALAALGAGLGAGAFNPLAGNNLPNGVNAAPGAGAGGARAPGATPNTGNPELDAMLAAGSGGMYFEDKIAIMMADIIKKMQQQIEARLEKLKQQAEAAEADKGGGGGFLGGLLGGGGGGMLGGIGQIAGGIFGGPVGAAVGGMAGNMLGGALGGGGGGGGKAGGGSESRNIEFEMLKNEMQKMSQMQQAFSNVLNEMHNLAMSSIRQIGK